ncbi:dihydroorotate dehydrogenase [bacterium]|nr:MAG: dihydroorotate dehydrogenase [bacterium]
MKPKLSVKIGKLVIKNPVMVASGTFGYAEEFKGLVDPNRLGAIVTKTITLNPREGNPPPRTCETPAGMLNSIGLENPGLDKFISEKMPILRKFGPPLIVSIASETGPEEFVTLARHLDKTAGVAAIELNISCPNIKLTNSQTHKSTKLIAQDARATYELVKAVRKVTKKTLITKLSPNVTFIAEIARAAKNAGSDAISLINTLMGMSIDVRSRKPKLAMVQGGLSGPAIRPVAVYMVREVYRTIRIPIIGMGGIMDVSGALEFLIAGATAVSLGTANFINPASAIKVISGLENYLRQNRIQDIRHMIGSLKE